MLPFGVVAPEALHGTTLEEHGCANARSVVQGETLDVENNICGIHDNTVLERERRMGREIVCYREKRASSISA